ncbi:2'-5' RNA ligase family protein [Streptomyces sp. NPDC085596]|uniref:2'-5' RNA ligase family protein n=1 Tax=Streptomyces sp. NPDC085596 TaxID=3365731 RepID=UPI0037CD8319
MTLASSDTLRNHWWWRPGWSVGRRFYTWHLTWEGQDDVHRLAAEYRDALAPFAGELTLIPDRWLHLTMQGIGFVGEVAEKDVRAIADAASERLAAVPAFDVQVGPHVLAPEAVLLTVHPAGSVHAVRSAIRGAIGDVLNDVDPGHAPRGNHADNPGHDQNARDESAEPIGLPLLHGRLPGAVELGHCARPFREAVSRRRFGAYRPGCSPAVGRLSVLCRCPLALSSA